MRPRPSRLTLEALEDAMRSSTRGVRAAARLALGREGAAR